MYFTRKTANGSLLDYKTNDDPLNLDTKYQAQMTAYISAFREMTGETTDALIYHINV